MRKGLMKRLMAVAMAVCTFVGTAPLNSLAQEMTVQEKVQQERNARGTSVSGNEGSEQEEPGATGSEGTKTVSGNENKDTERTQEPEPSVSDGDARFTEDLPEVLASGDTTPVSRITWLKELTEAFEMTVEEDNYPDNYYSDIDTSYAEYYTVMLATEFGLVDVEAGDAFCPEEPATREYAAHTLNLCMGYPVDPETDSSFAEEASVTYPDDIRVAIQKGWLTLESGAFLPGQAVTVSEKDAMMEAARQAVAATTIDPNYQSTYQFADNVTVLPESVEAVLTDENQLTLSNCTVALKAGDIFGIVSGGFPVAYKAVSVTASGDKLIVTTERVDTQDAFISMDFQGSMDADLSQIKAFDDSVQLKYIVGGTEEEKYEDGIKYDSIEEVGDQGVSAVEVIQSYEISEEVRDAYDIGEGVTADITCKISNVSPQYKADKSGVYIGVEAKVIFGCNVSMDVLKDLGILPSWNLAYVPIGHLGYMKLTLDMSLEGKVTVSTVTKISAGVQYEYKKGFRTVSGFSKEAFTLQAQGTASVGVQFSIGLNCGVVEGSIYGKMGGKAEAKLTTYSDGETPTICMHVGAWMYASIGIQVKVKLLFIKVDWAEELKIYDEKNSPVRVYYHYEDGKPVSFCTRDGRDEGESGDEDEGSGTTTPKKYKYYTPADSKYGYNGASKGVDSQGNEYTIFDCSLDDEGNATITKYQGNVSALSIPDTLDGHKVVGIGRDVFKNKTQLRVVVIPDSVTSIGYNAFEGCGNLSSVTMSKGVAEIGEEAFGNCEALTNIEIPKSLEKVRTNRYGVFRGCDNLKNVTFEKGTTRIVNSLFKDCLGIEQIEIPDTVTEIQDNAFCGCKNLRSIKIPDSMTSIGGYAFTGCTALTEIVIPDSVTSIGYNAFENCSNLSSVTMPKGVTEIGEEAFGNCEALTNIEIPKSLEKVRTNRYGVFRGCDNLKNVTFEKGTTRIVNSLFKDCLGIEQIEIPDTVTEIQDNAFCGCKNLRSIKIPDSMTSIGGYAFTGCTALTEIVIPDSVTSIGYSAFEDCSNLSSVTLSKNLTEIGGGTFGNCGALTNIEIPKSLEEVGTYGGGVFKDCDNLKNITFEKEITWIVGELFKDCPGIEQIEIPSTVTEIKYSAFRNCKNLSNIKIPGSVTSIEAYAFSGCTALTEALIPNSVSSMGIYMFDGCTSLQKVTLPDTRVNITEGIFRGCSSLKTLEIPDSVQYIRKYAFQESGLTNITLPDGLLAIEESAFRKCADLESIALPDSLTSIGTYCFAECDKLGTVTLGSGLTQIPAYAFNLCQSLEKVELPYRMQTVAANAFTNCTSLKEVTVPRSTTSIATNSFSYPKKMTIYGISGTYAETYANSIGATFVNREVAATKVQLSETNMTLNRGKTATLVLTVTPQNFTDEVAWKSSNTDVVTVNDAGVVTAKAVGTATIRVTVGNVSASCKVTVKQPVTSVYLNRSSLTLEGGETFTLTASVYPSNADNKNVEWSSSDEKVTTVDQNGLVTAVGKGSATITAAAADGSGVKGTCTVTVTSNNIYVTDIADFASTHPYENNCADNWIYTKSGAAKLEITFSDDTEVEDEFDYIFVYDKAGKEVGKYTGSQLAGKSVTVDGDTVRIKLVSDGQGNAYGFRVTKVEETKGEAPAPAKFTVAGVVGGRNVTFKSDTQGAVIYYSTKTSNITTNDTCVKNGETVLFENFYGTVYARPYLNGVWGNVSKLILKIPVVNTPVITVKGSEVSIKTTTGACTIYYTTDGSTPSPTNGKKLTKSAGSFTVEGSCTVKAIAVRSCFTNSAVASAQVKVSDTKPGAPSFGVKGVIGGREVTFNSKDSKAEIYYSFTTSNITTKDKHVKAGEKVLFENYYGTVYAKAYLNGKWSNVSRLVLKIPTVNTPSITSAGNGKVKITTTTPNCIIYYTTDGSTPSPTNGRRVSSSSTVISVGAGKTVKAIAVRSCFTNSKVVTYKK